MSIYLSLDNTALAALFPEGTEARLALRNAVIDQAVKRLVQKDLNLPDFQNSVRLQVEQAASEAIARAGVVIKGRRITIGQEVKESLQTEADEALKRAIAEGMDLSPERLGKLRDELLANLQQRLDHDIGQMLEQRVALALGKHMEQRIAAAVTQALTNLTSKA
jgi:hypothetical protein